MAFLSPFASTFYCSEKVKVFCLTITTKGEFVNMFRKIPHTGDTESLDRCE